MKYYSLNKQAPDSSFENAVRKGLAPDRGLYFPEQITPLNENFFEKLDELSNSEIAFKAIQQFVGEEIPKGDLEQIVEETLNFKTLFAMLLLIIGLSIVIYYSNEK